ncbi:MAG: hypothetical protein IIV59_09290, partial [Selenomonadaceae bacterium]|nr:hypothetical protein [Selenomonadaceae bacterium]
GCPTGKNPPVKAAAAIVIVEALAKAMLALVVVMAIFMMSVKRGMVDDGNDLRHIVCPSL